MEKTLQIQLKTIKVI